MVDKFEYDVYYTFFIFLLEDFLKNSIICRYNHRKENLSFTFWKAVRKISFHTMSIYEHQNDLHINQFSYKDLLWAYFTLWRHFLRYLLLLRYLHSFKKLFCTYWMKEIEFLAWKRSRYIFSWRQGLCEIKYFHYKRSIRNNIKTLYVKSHKFCYVMKDIHCGLIFLWT